MGFMRIQLRLEEQGFLMPCQAPAAPLFILSWQTCPLNAEQDLHSPDPVGFFIRELPDCPQMGMHISFR